jgi:hypothetical protein
MTDASTRAMLGIVTGPAGGDKTEAEQKLLDKTLRTCPGLFTLTGCGSLTEFPGAARINKMIARTRPEVNIHPVRKG